MDLDMDLDERARVDLIELFVEINSNNLDGVKDKIKQIEEHNGNINVQDEHYGTTPLIAAIEYQSSPEIVQFLIDKGADVKLENEEEETPLMAAILRNNTSAAKILLKKLEFDDITGEERAAAFKYSREISRMLDVPTVPAPEETAVMSSAATAEAVAAPPAVAKRKKKHRRKSSSSSSSSSDGEGKKKRKKSRSKTKKAKLKNKTKKPKKPKKSTMKNKKISAKTLKKIYH